MRTGRLPNEASGPPGPPLAESGLEKLATIIRVIFDAPSFCFTLFCLTTSATLVDHRRPHSSLPHRRPLSQRETPRSLTPQQSPFALYPAPFQALVARFVLREAEKQVEVSPTPLRQLRSLTPPSPAPLQQPGVLRFTLRHCCVSDRACCLCAFLRETAARSGQTLLRACARLECVIIRRRQCRSVMLLIMRAFLSLLIGIVLSNSRFCPVTSQSFLLASNTHSSTLFRLIRENEYLQHHIRTLQPES